MPAVSASAPGKIILFGEHAVVFGYPAIAVPVNQVQAKTIVSANPKGEPGEVWIDAPNIDLKSSLDELPKDDPIGTAIQGVLDELQISRPPAVNLRITSTIPVAAGLGSSAAVSVSIIRGLSEFLGHPLADEQISELAYQVEKIHHGTPSGIDNTVVARAKPVFFRRNSENGSQANIDVLGIAQPFTILIADSGVPSPTAITVAEVRQGYQQDPTRYRMIFEAVEMIVNAGREAVESGHIEALGPLMDENHELLQQMGVSSPELDRLVEVARSAGALGAKLSGGGRGGNIIALVSEDTAKEIAGALQAGAATGTIITTVEG